MLGMLVAYDADGNIIHAREYQWIYDPDTLAPIELANYIAHEEGGGENTHWWNKLVYDLKGVDKKGNAIWELRADQPVKGSKVWPEWIGAHALHFKVRLEGPPGNKRITALIHKESGHVRERAAVEQAIADRIDGHVKEAKKHGDEMRANFRKRNMPESMVSMIQDPAPEPVDVTDLLGSPDRPLQLDDDGKTKARVKAERSKLPVIKAG